MAGHILLVEDDPVSRDVLGALLTARGYTVDAAEDGFGALRMAQEQIYDLIFIDYHLPEMDGYALARLMRSLGATHGSAQRMVAITADRFGLVARRGVDAVFDRVVAKPIEPDALFALVEELVVERNSAEALETFLAETPLATDAPDAASAAHLLWRARGVEALPAAAVLPAPSPIERERVASCFRLVAPEAADCLLLLRHDGVRAIEELRATGESYLQPVFALHPDLAEGADLLFAVGDGASWSRAAACLSGFRERRAMLRPEVVSSTTLATRLAAFLHVCGTPLRLSRDRFGHTSVPYAGGFAPSDVIGAVKDLAAQHLVAASPSEANADGIRELTIRLTERGTRELTRPATAGRSA